MITDKEAREIVATNWEKWLASNPGKEELEQTLTKLSNFTSGSHPSDGVYLWVIGEIAIRLGV